jgi:ABC-type multidrug transport system fused ATPase/permease subunit
MSSHPELSHLTYLVISMILLLCPCLSDILENVEKTLTCLGVCTVFGSAPISMIDRKQARKASDEWNEPDSAFSIEGCYHHLLLLPTTAHTTCHHHLLPTLPPPQPIPTTTTMDLAVEVKKLCFSYQGNNSEGISGEQTLQDVDLVLPKGARCLLVGANGCKSTRPHHISTTRIEPRLSTT